MLADENTTDINRGQNTGGNPPRVRANAPKPSPRQPGCFTKITGRCMLPCKLQLLHVQIGRANPSASYRHTGRLVSLAKSHFSDVLENYYILESIGCQVIHQELVLVRAGHAHIFPDIP